MPVNLEKTAKQVVDLAGNAGADDVWATVSNSRDVEFEFRDGALEKVKDTTARGLNIQVFADGRYSTHQTTDLNVDRLAGFVKEAVAITRALEPDEFRKITPEEFFNNRPVDNLDLVDAGVDELSREQRMEWCRELDAEATDHERVISATAGVYDGTSRSASVSSNGFSGSNESTYCWYGSEITLKDKGDRRASDGFYAGGAHIETLPPAQEVARTALNRAFS